MRAGSSLKAALPFAAPGLLVVLPAAAGLALAPESPLMTEAAAGYPFAALALALVLAWRFRRSRLFAAALALGGAHLLLRPWAFGESTTATAAAAAALPLLLAGLALAADRRVGSPRGLLQGGAVALVGCTVAFALAVAPELPARWLGHPLVDPRHTAWTGLEPPVLLAALLGTGVVIATAVLRRQPVEAGLAWVLVAAIPSLALPAASAGRGVLMLAAGLVLVLTLVESSYRLAYRDHLTGLPGRRALHEALASLRTPYTVAVVDVDRFKGINDRYGHGVGDQVLRMVASRLTKVGGGGRVFRSGGEEFTIVFRGLTKAEAAPHVQAARAAVAGHPFAVRRGVRIPGARGARRRGRGPARGRHLRVSVSAGLASPRTGGEQVQAVVDSADRAMYRAKKAGRNRVA